MDARNKTLDNCSLAGLVGARQWAKERLEKEEAEFALRCKPLKDALMQMEGEIVRRMDEHELTNVKTVYGTAFFQWPTSMKVTDRDLFFKWVKDNDAFDVLTSNVSKEAIREREITPPGVEITKIRKLYIRKSE